MNHIPQNGRKARQQRPAGEIFHAGIAHRLGLEGLIALRDALQADDPALLQNETVLPDINTHDRRETCTGACAIGLALWRGLELQTIGEVEYRFCSLAVAVDAQLGAGSCMRWVQWFDELERNQMRRELLPQVLRAIEHEEGVPDAYARER
jgi:hypothetical protein